MSDQQTPPVSWPDFWAYQSEILSGHEVMDVVTGPAIGYGLDAYGTDSYGGEGTVIEERMVNEAANDELRRRGLTPTQPSGEVDPYSVVWVTVPAITKDGYGRVISGGQPV